MDNNPQQSVALKLVAEERLSQLEKHGYSLNHDIEINGDGELVTAAKALLTNRDEQGEDFNFPALWNAGAVRKMCSKSYQERLVIAAALIIAEIDRIQLIDDTDMKDNKTAEQIRDEKRNEFFKPAQDHWKWSREEADFVYNRAWEDCMTTVGVDYSKVREALGILEDTSQMIIAGQVRALLGQALEGKDTGDGWISGKIIPEIDSNGESEIFYCEVELGSPLTAWYCETRGGWIHAHYKGDSTPIDDVKRYRPLPR